MKATPKEDSTPLIELSQGDIELDNDASVSKASQELDSTSEISLAEINSKLRVKVDTEKKLLNKPLEKMNDSLKKQKAKVANVENVITHQASFDVSRHRLPYFKESCKSIHRRSGTK